MKNEISKKEMQWRIYIEAKEAVLGGPRTQWAPQFIKKNGCGITITRNAFNKNLIKLLIWFGYGVVGAPRRITVAWGLPRPKSGPEEMR